jgi:dihydrofolate reductase
MTVTAASPTLGDRARSFFRDVIMAFRSKNRSPARLPASLRRDAAGHVSFPERPQPLECRPVRPVIYSMGVSVDGFIAGPGGDISWAAPDEELHRFHNEQSRELGVHLCGRRLYETMVAWETVDQDPEAGELMVDFAGLWQRLEKVVFSTTLTTVVGRSRLARAGLVQELGRLRAQPGGAIAVGGAGLAAELIERDLVDEYRLFVSPIVLGAGTPFFPARSAPLGLYSARDPQLRFAGGLSALPLRARLTRAPQLSWPPPARIRGSGGRSWSGIRRSPATPQPPAPTRRHAPPR